MDQRDSGSIILKNAAYLVFHIDLLLPWNLNDIDWKSVYCYKITSWVEVGNKHIKVAFYSRKETAVLC